MQNWNIKERPNTSRIQKELAVSSTLATILYWRDIRDVDGAKAFLYPDISNLYSPFLFPDMEKAVARINEALKRREKILIWGDEDVDGMTATFLLFRILEDLGGLVNYWIPRRVTHGIGLSEERLKTAKENGETLIITVDCGSSDKELVEYAAQLGIDIVITDHHEVRNPPSSFAFLNPKGTSYPFKQLAGVGVSLKLALALTESILGLNVFDFFRTRKDLLPFALLGTISDRVPLLGENRIIVRFGLGAFPKINKPAIQVMQEIMGTDEPVVEDIFEKIVPVLSSGRAIKEDNPVMRFFFSKTKEEAREILEILSKEQQHFEEEFEVVYGDCVSRAGKDGIIVVNDIPCPFLGSCASKLVKEKGNPAILIGYKSGDIYIGEGRAPSDFDLVDFLQRNEKLFICYGGHKQAAGFSIRRENIASFMKSATGVEYRKNIENDSIEIDVTLDSEDFSKTVLEELRLLMPFGESNPKPILAIMNARLECSDEGYKLAGIPISDRNIPLNREIDIVLSFDNRGMVRVEDWRDR